MPTNQIRNGNSIIKSCNYTLAHGSAPQPFDCIVPYLVAIAQGHYMQFLLSGSNYFGIVTDVKECVDEDGGLYSAISGVDRRDELYSKVVFAKINTIDESDGSVYSEFAPENPFIRELEPEDSRVFAGELIQWLIEQNGFSATYSTRADRILNAESQDRGWEDSRYNLFNIDWTDGIKVGPALDQICESLGLQLTVLDGNSKTLRFSVRGVAELEDFQWSTGALAVSRRIGRSVQPDVDTGVWIVGEKSVIEFKGVPLVPDWDELWTAYKYDPYLMQKDLDTLGLDKRVNLVSEFLGSEGHIDGRYYNDMTILEYIEKIVYKVYRLDGIDNFLTDSEIEGSRRVRENPICDHLVTDPKVDSVCYVHPYNLDNKEDNLSLRSPDEYVKIYGGYKLYKDTGQVVFDESRFKLTAAFRLSSESPSAPPENKKVRSSSAEPDDCYMDVAVYGKLYRELFGTSERIGSNKVGGLYQSFVVEAAPKEGYLEEDPAGAEEYFYPGEKRPRWIAEDVAISLLARPREIISGDSEFRGVAGHIPTGEIQRVSVSLNEGGLTETVSFANDEASPAYEPQVELRRKIATDREVKRIDRVKRDIERGKLAAAIKLANSRPIDERTNHDMMVKQAMSQFNRDNWMLVGNTTEAVATGEPIAGELDSNGKFQMVKNADLEDDDPRLVGVAVLPFNEQDIPVATAGIVEARVIGPVKPGEALGYDKANKCLKAGSGSIISLIAYEDTEVKMIPCRIGGGGAAGALIVRAASISNLTLSGTLTHDGVALAVGDEVLAKNQTTASQNGVYVVKSTAWTLVTQAENVLICEGGQADTQWFLQAPNVYHQVKNDIVRVVRLVATASVTASGSQTVDGVVTSNNDLVLLPSNTGSDRCVWRVNTSGAWAKLNQPLLAIAVAGTSNTGCAHFLSAANVYTSLGAYFK